MERELEKLLKKSRLSVTDSRVKILELFFNQQGALAHGDIEKRTGEKFDRVTVYRTLQAFLTKGIIHTIPTNDNSIRYALCKDTCEEGHHHDNHVHFVCNDCGNTTCLEEIIIPEIKLPKGYASNQVEMIVSGICRACKKG
ncbi:MAG TPA: Fur family transcriptional regulator [Flavihumibacter sp.]|nr:transcriptional repressor [Bacteroidota bacterium]HOA36965.1 Fur family transcriptional regulator [Flavihumibacter sp.]HPZ86456.1 Fur family transcriptional regulator [Flavihumibacter sp.]HQD09432.1 Fur family transcriptional regulator [Flavihumibacter sp.]